MTAAAGERLRDDFSSGRGSETSSQASKATQNLVIAGRAPLMMVGRSVGRRLSKRSTRLADALSFDPCPSTTHTRCTGVLDTTVAQVSPPTFGPAAACKA
jgi:hypothetical protein